MSGSQGVGSAAWGTAKAAIVAVSAVLLIVAVGGCEAAPDDESTPTPSSSTPAASQSPTASPSTEAVPVYYLTDTPDGLRLAREFQRAEVDEGRAATAVSRMLSEPAADPDYSSPWNPDSEVLAVDITDDVITVDLSADARTASVGAAAAELAVQQLVYTVTAAEQSDAAVQLLIEGEPAGELWGHVVWDSPLGRAPALDVRLLVQINDPSEGAAVSTQFAVTGEAATFEAVLPWKILDSAGAVVQEGAAMTAEGQTLAPFEFTVDFTADPGTYTLQIEEDDPSGGEGGPVMTDDKTITIG